ncbi:MAG: radical SAM/SPASM domain-containing protein [Kiritimatiellia bacterium]|nr:radical SAM/SPASM domain-containing protein [Kiritimatiellia bacterium]
MSFLTRMMREPDKRLLWKFCWNFGFKGMRAVDKFQKRIKAGEYFPAFLFISVTDKCNLSCQGCWVTQASPSRELDIETLDRVVEECKKKGSYFFGILGGEPLMHKGLFDLFERHPDAYFLLFTNGLLITDATASRMRELGNVSPLISIEGNVEVSDVRRGGKDVYQRTIDAIEICRKHRLVIGAATSICKSNIGDLATEAFVNQLASIGVHYLWYYIYRPVGPDPTPELALDPGQVLDLRRFIVDVRTRAPMLIVDAYWDHDGKALCPAAVGIGHHISPAGDIEPCPPIQFAAENIGDATDLHARFSTSEFLRNFRNLACKTTQGCIIMENPELLREFLTGNGAEDTSGRDTAFRELEDMLPHRSQHMPGEEIPEKSWAYRFAKKHWFFGFGAYG